MTAYSLHMLGLLLTASAGAGGLWGVLRLVIRGRNAVALERERRATTIATLERLPPGARIMERDAYGRSQLIYRAEAACPGDNRHSAQGGSQ